MTENTIFVQSSITMAKTKKKREVSLLEYVDKHNPVLNRRGTKMSFSYLYRLIREHEKGVNKRELWFDYSLVGEHKKVVIYI